MEIIINITPKPKPRMVKSDAWRKRPVVLSYWAFKKELQLLAKCAKLELQDELNIIFYLPMPKSWSKKKKAAMNGKPHKQTPDCDNILKTVQDCLCKQDSFIWKFTCEKRWAENGSIVFNRNKTESR